MVLVAIIKKKKKLNFNLPTTKLSNAIFKVLKDN